MSKKVRLEIEEKLTYLNELIVIQPDDMTNEQFDQLLSQIERISESTDDVAFFFTQKEYPSSEDDH